jgi:hypothetical protein
VISVGARQLMAPTSTAPRMRSTEYAPARCITLLSSLAGTRG